MISRPSLNDLKDKADSPFTIVIMAARRARNLNEGGRELLKEYKGRKAVSKSLEEIAADVISYEKKKPNSVK